MNRVLLVEDTVAHQMLVSRALGDSVELKIADTFAAATQLLDSEEFEVLLLDVNLPDGSGFGLCSHLAANGRKIPRLIFLTGSHLLADKLTGFNVGGDDYLTKPCDPLELKARVLAHLRSIAKSESSEPILQVSGLTIDLLSHSVTRTDAAGLEEIRLTPTEFKLLHTLAKNEGRILSRERLLEAITFHNDVTDRLVDTHVSNLRKKIGSSPCIEGVYGIGYRLVRDDSGRKS